ncbi:alpha/beta fold hydrolase [Actinoplanes sp. M2I2]|uniref:alpha/beta fold hydrolase n=1 Tax=Actinoplanes sp. M2I2 TaxID=1734444 RepID=UPI0020209C55|nr:alpha/beta hydrolase [Actinoplanes sp. M2I2]
MTLSHDSDGTGPAVLLLHSTVCDRRMWGPQVAPLTAAGFRVVRCDLPGYGDSPVPPGPVDVAAEVLGVLDALGIGPAAVVGSSGGGQVALELAGRWPGRVSALALLCAASPELSPGPELRSLWQRENELLDAGDVEAATELNVRFWVGPHADDQARALVREMQRHAFEVQLASPGAEELETAYDPAVITAPALLVSGAHDLPEFGALAADLATRLPDARHVELDWAGHLPSLEDPDRLNAVLLPFLQRVSSPKPQP